MRKNLTISILWIFISTLFVSAQINQDPPQVKTVNGFIEGVNHSGIHVFKGIPFAAPPVGEFRWRAPQPVQNWQGIREAVHFGPRPMQNPIYSDMQFRSDTISEDCLYLNVWTPSKTGKEKLPVLVYFYGGGFMAGSSDEYRYDGERMARYGIVTVTANYRLGIFGFFSYPELTKESPHHSSGNYGYLDQVAALEWVKANIAAFGGDPDRVTIAGESAGSISVSALVCSPLSKDLIAGAIGSSGSLLGALPPVALKESEQHGLQAAKEMGAASLKDLRALSGADLLKVRGRFSSTIDGYFFPEAPPAIYASGKQAHIPVLIGWNSEEMNYNFMLRGKEPTVANLKASVESTFKDQTDEVLKLYHVTDDASVIPAATALASDMFIGFSTWKWCNMQEKTGGHPVYRYFYRHPRPAMFNAPEGATPATGAVHSADIEYAMGNLPTNRVYDWQPGDYVVSYIFQEFYANFVKTGNPNGLGVPDWPSINHQPVAPVMQIDVNTYVLKDGGIERRYQFLDHFYNSGK